MSYRPIGRVRLGLAAGIAVLVSAVGAGVAAAENTPAQTGCPTAYALLSVTALEAQGPYQLPALVDGDGNNDGYVCGFPLPAGAEKADCQIGSTVACELIALGLPTYRFVDNDLAASQHAQAGS
jgi:hypothetical protein